MKDKDVEHCIQTLVENVESVVRILIEINLSTQTSKFEKYKNFLLLILQKLPFNKNKHHAGNTDLNQVMAKVKFNDI